MSMFEYQLFCTIAEQKNMARASEMLHITPSAATHAMNALERRVGFPLINRSRRGITLTTNGQLLLSMVQTILSDEELLWQEIAKINMTLDHNISKQLELLGEGQQMVIDKFKQLDQVAEDVEDIKDTVNALEAITKSNTTQIKELRIAK